MARTKTTHRHFSNFETITEDKVQFVHPICGKPILVLHMGISARWVWASGICRTCDRYVHLRHQPEHRSLDGMSKS